MIEVIQNRLAEALANADIDVQMSGNHCQLKVISDLFSGLNSLKRQQKIYACLQDLITDGTLHAVNMSLYTLEEWEKAKRFGI